MGRAARPVILLAFANPRRDLAKLKEETSGLRKIFRRNHDVELMILDHPSLDDVEYAFQRNRNRIAIFHYGGHASGFRKMLESDRGDVQEIDVRGFAKFLGGQTGHHVR